MLSEFIKTLTAKDKLELIESQLLASIRGKILAINSQQERMDAMRKDIENTSDKDIKAELQEKCEFTKFLQDTYLTELHGLREATAVALNIIYNYETGKAWDIIYKEEQLLIDDLTVLLKNS